MYLFNSNLGANEKNQQRRKYKESQFKKPTWKLEDK